MYLFIYVVMERYYMPGMPGPRWHHTEHIDILALSWTEILVREGDRPPNIPQSM